MSTQTVAYFNGEFVPTSEARVSVLDSALIWGDMVFETTRTFQGRPFRLHEHLKRLYASMNVADIDRVSTVRRADLILVLDEGRVVERGTHDELVARGGFYSRIYDLQLRPQEEAPLVEGPAAVAGGDG